MKKLFSIFLILFSTLTFGQTIQFSKVVVISDSIVVMSQAVGGRPQIIIPAPAVGQSIIVHSIAIRNKVNNRLYSPDSGVGTYLIGYQNGSYWYTLTQFSFDQLNAKANTTYYFEPTINTRFWESTQTDASPLVLKFESPLNLDGTGSNRLTLYITYSILN